MNELTVKEVEFNGDTLMAAQEKSSKKIYVAVTWVCNGIGLNENQRDRQVKNVQSDLVLSKGVKNLSVKFDGQVRNVVAVELDFLPLWLAKISITPKMKENNPFMVQKLVDYQLKAKDILAEAFVKKHEVSGELRFLQELLDKMVQNELEQKELQNKVTHIETELTKETLIEGQVNSNNIARELSIFSMSNKPHSQFIDAVAQELKIYSNVVGYSDKYTKVIRETGRGGKITGVAYYSDKGVELIEQYIENNFVPEGKFYVRGKKKGQFNESVFELGSRKYRFNKSTFKKHGNEHEID